MSHRRLLALLAFALSIDDFDTIATRTPIVASLARHHKPRFMWCDSVRPAAYPARWARERLGISIRTLHHYDDIGLVSPSRRTESGHRLYDREDVVRAETQLDEGAFLGTHATILPRLRMLTSPYSFLAQKAISASTVDGAALTSGSSSSTCSEPMQW